MVRIPIQIMSNKATAMLCWILEIPFVEQEWWLVAKQAQMVKLNALLIAQENFQKYQRKCLKYWPDLNSTGPVPNRVSFDSSQFLIWSVFNRVSFEIGQFLIEIVLNRISFKFVQFWIRTVLNRVSFEFNHFWIGPVLNLANFLWGQIWMDQFWNRLV